MNGCVLPHSPIAVDYWKIRQCQQAKIFFLTHMHADHTNGLTPSWSRPIYCTSVTSKLLQHKFKIKRDLIRELEINASHIVPLDSEGQETVTVSVIDAHHCPGAAMFLFHGYFGTILYTGDFRYADAMFVNTPLSQPLDIDVLYLDNTYCEPQCEFPTRLEVLKLIFKIIGDHPDHLVLIEHKTLGKEDMLVAIAKYFQTWIVVEPKYYETLEVLEVPNVFTTDSSKGHIHVLQHKVNKKTRTQWEDREGIPTIGLLPTCVNVGLNDSYMYNAKDKIFMVPYSDHSSYSELHKFVSRIKPKHVRPVVKCRAIFGVDISIRSDMSCFNSYLDQNPRHFFQIPQSVVNVIKSRNISPVKTNRPKSRKRVLVSKMRHCKGVVFDTPSKNEEKVVKKDMQSTSHKSSHEYEKILCKQKSSPSCDLRTPKPTHCELTVGDSIFVTGSSSPLFDLSQSCHSLNTKLLTSSCLPPKCLNTGTVSNEVSYIISDSDSDCEPVSSPPNLVQNKSTNATFHPTNSKRDSDSTQQLDVIDIFSSESSESSCDEYFDNILEAENVLQKGVQLCPCNSGKNSSKQSSIKSSIARSAISDSKNCSGHDSLPCVLQDTVNGIIDSKQKLSVSSNSLASKTRKMKLCQAHRFKQFKLDALSNSNQANQKRSSDIATLYSSPCSDKHVKHGKCPITSNLIGVLQPESKKAEHVCWGQEPTMDEHMAYNFNSSASNQSYPVLKPSLSRHTGLSVIPVHKRRSWAEARKIFDRSLNANLEHLE